MTQKSTKYIIGSKSREWRLLKVNDYESYRVHKAASLTKYVHYVPSSYYPISLRISHKRVHCSYTVHICNVYNAIIIYFIFSQKDCKRSLCDVICARVVMATTR